MKKLMLTAACAAMTAGAFAGVAQVYDMTLNVKTTECKKSNKAITDACGTHYFYRAQKSYKFEGKFWGCGCPTIANPIEEQYGMPRLEWVEDWSCDDNSNSYMFWGPKMAFHHVTFSWELLQLVGQKSSNIEGVFNAAFYICDGGEVVEDVSLDLRGAGYGTAKVTACEDDEAYLNQITSMSGSVVGIYDVADAVALVGCPYCGSETDCVPFQFCPCVDVLEEKSAAYGTFTLKFNTTLANKIMSGKYIDQAYTFKDFVKEEFDCIAAGETPTERTSAETTYDNAKAAYTKAQAAAVAADAEAAAAFSTYRVAWTNSNFEAAAKSTALWIDGTNDTAKAVAALQKASEDYRTLCSNENYWALSEDDTVTNAVDTYLTDAREYLRKDAELKINGPYLDSEAVLTPAEMTNEVAELKVKVANDYLALENAIAAVTAGQTVKTTFTAAIKAIYDAYETYYNTAIKYVGLTPDDEPMYYGKVGKWAQKQLDAVTTAAYNDYQVKDAAAQKAGADADEAYDTLKTAKIICDATGGDCN